MTPLALNQPLPGSDLPLPYWRETQRPFCNLIFLLPLLFAYEFGIGLAGLSDGAAFRNGADAWIRLWMNQAGIHFVWLPPVVLVSILAIWQWTTRQPWKTTWETFGGMAAESLLYAFVLIMLGQVTDLCFRNVTPYSLDVDTTVSPNFGLFLRAVTFMGAGIYEEFLFRLCLLPLTYVAFRALYVPKNWAIAGTVISTSVVFSLAHYLGHEEDGHLLALLTEAVVRVQSSRELWFGFVFRTLAGMVFAALYFLRGFGITVGAHAAYDVFVGVILIQEI